MANPFHQDIRGRYALIKKHFLKEEFHDDHKRLVLCKDGFGCSSFTSGGAVFTVSPFDGERARYESFQLERLVEGRELAILLARCPKQQEVTT